MLKDSDLLDLPDAPDFISEAPVYSLKEMIRICEGMLPYWNSLRYAQPEPEFLGGEFSLSEEFGAGPEADSKPSKS